MSLFIEIFLIGVGLSMDAFAVSICKGLSMQKVKKRDVFIIALFFGGFQALMPFIGWFLGRGFESYIKVLIIGLLLFYLVLLVVRC